MAVKKNPSKSEVRAMYRRYKKDYHTLRMIAEDEGVSHITISRWFKDMDLPLRPRGRVPGLVWE